MKWELYERNSLGDEPKWLEKRKKRYMKDRIENKGKEWSKTEDCYLANYYKQGKKLKEIAELLSRTISAVDARLTFLGVKRTRITINWKPIEVEMLMQMRKEDKTYGEIAEELGRTEKSVKRKMDNLLISEKKKVAM
ncbi:MAG: hypothetical protein LLF98_11670 [Clostridium sp.]|uniref:hypothetical protein n=1 Tax=Clostridium sp. TaxID=1506 RepID=UPI0025B7C502|nr:hypothetical protein [Clostridium sp.]MCE5221887.1 hypothetical protein [Clostridium sp.]